MADEHRLQIHCPNGSPSEATVRLDGEQLMFVSRVELVLDTSTREATARLTVPLAMLDLDVDAAAFVTAHTDEPVSVASPARVMADLGRDTTGLAAGIGGSTEDLPLAEAAWAAVQARHREANGA